jgi:hypothetical protein
MVSRPPTPRSGPVGDLLVLAVNPPQAGGLSREGCGFEPYRQGVVCHVPDLSKSGFSCPRCKTIMDEVVRIAPLASEPGLIGYECPDCCYVTSVILPPNDVLRGARRNDAPLNGAREAMATKIIEWGAARRMRARPARRPGDHRGG